jgi:hypothetical protein
MSRKKAADSPAFASRPAAEGAAVSFTIHDQERTLEAVEGPDGWAITPADEEEARALEGMGDEALNPPAADAAEDSVQPPDDAAGVEGDQEANSSDENAGEPVEEVQA